ncbi:MAG: hypothetical protein DHS20C18_33850 [Saprospiraceae bacterium]|nr:MAG: hypothetical protein DHS20C18_33850 [Saprospiraceae bacterium]
MKTPDKILVVALQQFNEKGIDQVSIRTIAKEVGISAGNLAYHYKNTDTIMYALYLQLVEDLNKAIEQLGIVQPDINWLCEQMEANFRRFWQYKFILLDFAAVTRRVPMIREHFQQLVGLRQFQFRAAIHGLIEQGYWKEEWVDGMYDQYILRLIILSGAWIPDAEVHFDGDVEEIIPFYANLMLGSIMPFLTEKGIQQYQDFQNRKNYQSIRAYP